MNQDIKAPSVGESITEVRVGRWMKQSGESVKSGDVLLEIESDKATVEVASDFSGALNILKQTGETVKIGEVLAQVQEGVQGNPSVSASAPSPVASAAPAVVASTPIPAASNSGNYPLSPAAKKVSSDLGIDASKVSGTGKDGRVTKGDLLQYSETRGNTAVAAIPAPSPVSSPASSVANPRERRVPMTMLRQKIAERLVMAQHTAAILTTFNECDMSAVMKVRAEQKDAFKNKHGVGLSFMSFFTRAVVEALKAVPAVNGRIDGKEMVYHDYYDVGIAVGTERGLVVPVLRDAGSMGFVDIEKGIGALALKARDGKLSIKELTGGTFTISNGGTYGSLLSTPILNPPQSGILGMHKIQERPMVVNGQVVARPMMFLALSYDHRIIDGKEAVTFLIKVKDGIENPQTLGLDF